eukprot:1189675-Prorocentrum_minimum.AAC.2
MGIRGHERLHSPEAEAESHARGYSHGGPIRHRKCGYILTFRSRTRNPNSKVAFEPILSKIRFRTQYKKAGFGPRQKRGKKKNSRRDAFETQRTSLLFETLTKPKRNPNERPHPQRPGVQNVRVQAKAVGVFLQQSDVRLAGRAGRAGAAQAPRAPRAPRAC